MSQDPTPGDPALIQGVLKRYSDIGDAAEKALNVLKKGGTISSGRGSAMDNLQEKIGDDLPAKLTKTATSYHDAASAYRDYIPRLQEAQDTFDRAVEQAQSAAPQAGQTPAALPPDATDADKAAATKTQDAIDAGKSQLSAAKSLAEQAKAMRESAQRTASEVLDRAAGEAIPERNIFQKIADFFNDFPFVQILLGLLIAIVTVFFPVVGFLLGAAVFVFTQVVAIASGNFKLGDLLIGLLQLIPGASLIKVGAVAAKIAAPQLAKLVPTLAKTVNGTIKSVKDSINATKTIGPFVNSTAGKVTGASIVGFGDKSVDELAAEGINKDDLSVGKILGSGAAGLVGGGIAKKFAPPKKPPTPAPAAPAQPPVPLTPRPPAPTRPPPPVPTPPAPTRPPPVPTPPAPTRPVPPVPRPPAPTRPVPPVPAPTRPVPPPPVPDPAGVPLPPSRPGTPDPASDPAQVPLPPSRPGTPDPAQVPLPPSRPGTPDPASDPAQVPLPPSRPATPPPADTP